MNSRNKSKEILFFALLGVVPLLFILFSIWMMLAVREKRHSIDSQVFQISLISTLEVDLMACFEQSEDATEEEFRMAIDKVVSTDFQLEIYPELNELSQKIESLNKYFEVSGVLMSFEPFQDNLQNIYAFCIEEKKIKRKKLSELSLEIGEYWNYVHILLISACVLGLLLIFSGFIAYRANKNAKDLNHLNTLFFESMVDCVIASDNKGIITHFNMVAAEAFGYSMEEAIGMSIRELYAIEEECDKVQAALSRSDYFKGEILNQRKNGTQFIVYLSANTVFDKSGEPVGAIGIARDISIQKRNEEQFQHIVDNATDIIYTTNLNGEITYFNTSAKNVLGYEEEDIIGVSFQDLIHPDFAKFVGDFYAEQFKLRSKESYLEFKLIKENGESIWVGQNVKTTFSPTNSNEIVGYFGVLRNLDDIKKYQLELAESEEKYRELFDNSKDLIQSISPTGQILYVNNAWLNTIGYKKEELHKINLFDIVHPESIDSYTNLHKDILKFSSNAGNNDHVLKLLTRSGDMVILKGSINIRYENNQVKSIQTFYRDVTDKAKIEEALMKSEENFRLISSSINDVFFLYDIKNERYEYISPNSEEVLGAKSTSFMEGKVRREERIHENDSNLIQELDEHVRAGDAGEIEYRRHLVNGDIKWVSEKWFPITNESGDVVSISGICRDITDMKNAYDIIYNQNKEIKQSINYAQNIQESTLPTSAEIKHVLPDSFVFYKPKSVLSGDFYLVEQVKVESGELFPAFVIGDCTGHGVPGGLLSLLCSGLLRESLTNSNINSPAEALNFVRDKLIRLFRSNPTKYILDGMDAAFCVLNQKNNELYFAGANLSCFIIRGDEVLEYRGDKQHIGYSQKMMPFVHFAIDLEEGDQIYLTTDGYIDQFGGEKNKKFLRKRFIELLIKIKDLPMDEQQVRINDRFIEWKGDKAQTDDIAMIGVKY